MDKKQLKEQQRKDFVVQQKFLTSLSYYIHNSYTEMKRRPCYFCLSFFSVAIVVMASAISQSIIDRAPIIFMKTAEGPGGEIDVSIQPNYELLLGYGDENIPYLNTTQVINVVGNEYQNQITSRLTNLANGLVQCNVADEKLAETQCSFSSQGVIIHQDSEKELEIGLGREYPFKKLGPGEIIIHEKFALDLNVKEGDTAFIKVTVGNIFPQIRKYLCSKTQQPYCSIDYLSALLEIKHVTVPFKVKGILDNTYGKVPNGYTKKLVFAELEHFGYIGQFISNSQGKDFQQFGKDIQNLVNPQEFADKVLYNFEERTDLYLESDYDVIQYEISKSASNIAAKLGVFPIDMSLPVLSELYELRFGAMFLGIILNMIVFILFMLSLMLLYNLLLVSVETKNFELAVLRTLGLNKVGVVSLIIIQALSFVFPALIFGLLMSVLGLSGVSNALQGAISVEISVVPTFNAFLLSISVGILIPLFSSIVPIKNALGQTLSIALDINRSKSQAVKINIDIEGKSFPWGRISFASISTIFGISIYYFLPLSLLSFNLGLLINIFFWILVGMLLGFIMLMLNVQYLVERIVVYLTLFWTGAAIKSLILKNLGSHRLKNRRVAVMYSLSIAFIIFVWTFSTIQMQSSEFSQKQRHGTYLDVEIDDGFSFSRTYLPVKELENILDNEVPELIDSYSWITVNLDDFTGSREGFRDLDLTHIGKIYKDSPQVQAVSPNFLNTTFSEDFLKIKQRRNKDSDLDIIEELYTAQGSQSAIITGKTQDYIDVGVKDDDSFYLILSNGTYAYKHELQASSIIEGAPVFNTNGFRDQSVIVSFPTFMRLAHEACGSYEDLPMERLLIKTINQDKATVDRVFQVIQAFLRETEMEATIWDYRDYKEGIDQQQQVTSIIFSVLTVIVMVLCFFSLISSMTANIMEQSKEIAVLRAVGINKKQMVRLYIYEAYTLVLSSSLIGMFVGIIVGFTMGMQRALFTELPIAFEFPTAIFISVLISSILCALLSTYVPSKRIMNNQISQIIRMTG